MLSDLCQELRNWFDANQPRLYDSFKIEEGKITDDGFTNMIKEGQYFRVVGSVFNDGVYKYTSSLQLVDEEFTGSIWLMAIPRDVIDLADEISAWIEKNNEVISSPYQSESFGGYSYTKQANQTWQSTFASRLNKWRKI